MKKINILIGLFSLISISETLSQNVAIKANALSWLTATPAIAAEVKVADQWSVDLGVQYNPFSFSSKQWKHFLVQPEVRYWLCDAFNGHFIGAHAHYGTYDVKNLRFLQSENKRSEGNAYGAGLTYGYHYPLSDVWSIEGYIGLGYACLDENQYGPETSAPLIHSEVKHYIGPTRIGISFVYFIY